MFSATNAHMLGQANSGVTTISADIGVGTPGAIASALGGFCVLKSNFGVPTNVCTVNLSGGVGSWQLYSLPSSQVWLVLGTNGSRLVAMSKASGSPPHYCKVAYSDNCGVSWTAASDFDFGGDSPSQMTCNGSRFVVTGSGANYAYSDDGINFTKYAAPLPGSTTHALTSDGTNFIVAPSGSAFYARSTDGISWSTAALPFTSDWYSATSNGAVILLANQSNTTLLVSTDTGLTWSSVTLPFIAQVVSSNTSHFLAVPYSTVTTQISAFSTDGVTWNTAGFISGSGWYDSTTPNLPFNSSLSPFVTVSGTGAVTAISYIN